MCPFEGCIIATALEQVFEGGMEGFGGCEGEDKLDLGFVTRRVQRTFSK